MTFAAIYLPMRYPGEPEPNRDGFETKELALEYIKTQACIACQEKMNSGEEEWPGCMFEWIVVPSDKANLEGEELMEAAGWKTIYRKPSN